MNLRQFGSFLRLPNALTAGADVLTGVALVGAPLDGRAALAACGAAALYCGGIVLNDAMDSVKDAQEHPERAIPSGQISRNSALLLGMALLVAGFLPVVAAPERLPAMAALLIAVIVYDVLPEKWPLLSILAMAACRFFNMASGVLLHSTAVDSLPEVAMVALGCHAALIALVTWTSQCEGRRCSPRIPAILISCCFLIPGCLLLANEEALSGVLCTLCGAALGHFASLPARREIQNAAGTVRNSIRVLIPWCALWAWSAGSAEAAWIILSLWPLQWGVAAALRFRSS